MRLKLTKSKNTAPLYVIKSIYDSKTQPKRKRTKTWRLTKIQSIKNDYKNIQVTFNSSYLFLQHLYHHLGIHKICKDILWMPKFTLDLDSRPSRLIYGKVLFPSSKLNAFKESKWLLSNPTLNYYTFIAL